MKNLIILLTISLMFFSAQGQEGGGHQKTRKEKKEAKRLEKEKKLTSVEKLVNTKQFALEADFIKNKYGSSYSVSSMINFILINENEAIFQFGSASLVGANGLGGFTVKGKITKYNVSRMKNSVFVEVTIVTTSGFFDINLDIFPSRAADAEVATTMSNKRIGYSGKVVPLASSEIFIGREL